MLTKRRLLRRRPAVPFVDTLHPEDEITRTTVSEFERWRSGGCKVPPDLDPDAVSYFEQVQTAATTTAMYVMGTLAADPDPWVRLALATNPSAYPVILWGDGESDFGLAQDRNPWVRAAVWFRDPAPPQHIRAALSM